MRLAHMDGVVARVAEEADHRRRHLHVRRRGESLGAEAVDVPFRAPEDVRVQFLIHGGAVLAADGVGWLVLGHGGPVGDVTVDGVHPGHQAGAGRGRDRAGIGLREDDPLLGEPLHVRGVELAVAGIDLLAIGDGALRPAVVIDQEEDDIRAFGAAGQDGGQQCKGGEGGFSCLHGDVISLSKIGVFRKKSYFCLLTGTTMYQDYLKFYPDFPIKGVNFVDVLPFMQDKEVFTAITRDLGALCASPNVVAPEARGFLFASPMLAVCDNVKNILTLRKKGKIPYAEGDLVQVNILKEYGADEVFFRRSDILAGVPDGDTFRLTIFDDILATGGTAEGVARALNAMTVEKDGRTYRIEVTDFVFLVELLDLKGAERLTPIAPVKSLIRLEGTDEV